MNFRLDYLTAPQILHNPAINKLITQLLEEYDRKERIKDGRWTNPLACSGVMMPTTQTSISGMLITRENGAYKYTW